MALCLLIAGSYAAYKTYSQAELAATDESIKLEGKTKVTLLPGEKEQLLEIPLTCINWFKGDYRHVVPHMRQRVDEILKKNAFLAGWVIIDGEDPNHPLTLIFDEAGIDQNNRDLIFQVYDGSNTVAVAEKAANETPKEGEEEASPPPPTKLSLTPNTPYAECTKQLLEVGAMLPLQQALIGKDKPLIRISIVPDADEPTARFALVVSMTHALGDNHTFYKIINMLDVATGHAQELISERDLAVSKVAREKMGEDAFTYLHTAIKEPPVDMTATRNEPNVMKVFHLKESWFGKDDKGNKDKRVRRASMFVDAAADAEKNQGSGISQNSILSSWFFNQSKADIAFMGLSMRERLEGCLVSDFHAGNYTAGIPYTPADYATPELVEQSVATLKRCGTEEPLPAFRWNNSAAISLNWASHFQNKLQLIPPGEGDCQHMSHMILFDAVLMETIPGRLSLCYTFTSVPSEAKVGTTEHGIEVGIQNTAASMADIAAQVAAELEGLDDEAEDAAVEESLQGKRAGCLVVCRQSVWDEIERSGIVDEIIVG